MSTVQRPQLPNLRFLQTRPFTPKTLLTDVEKRNAIPQARQWFCSAASSLRARLRLCEDLIEALDEVDQGLTKIENAGDLRSDSIAPTLFQHEEVLAAMSSNTARPSLGDCQTSGTVVNSQQRAGLNEDYGQVGQQVALSVDMQMELDKVTEWISRVKVLRGQWMAGNKI